LNPIIISQGDAAGAGWHAFKKIVASRQIDLRSCLVVGDIFENDKAFIEKYFTVSEFSGEVPAVEKKKPHFQYLKHSKAIEPGTGNSLVALRSYHAFQKALKLFRENKNAALVTLPVSKELIMKAGINFTGHTEELATAFQTKVFMCMYHSKFSVIPLTNHIALANVPRKLYEVSLTDLGNAIRQFNTIFKPKAKAAWCGVNPHCGENGRIGTEEEFVRRGIESLAKSGIAVEGPISADAVFTKHVLKNYSLVLANYHDQGLIPFKALAGMAGINTTLGLPQLRVSPDHGTAFSQTAANQVDVTGVLASLRFAMQKGKAWAQASQ